MRILRDVPLLQRVVNRFGVPLKASDRISDPPVSRARPPRLLVGESVGARRKISALDIPPPGAPFDDSSDLFFDPPGRSRAAFTRSRKETLMAKRSTKRRHAQGVLNVQEFQRDERRQRNLQVLDGGYN